MTILGRVNLVHQEEMTADSNDFTVPSKKTSNFLSSEIDNQGLIFGI